MPATLRQIYTETETPKTHKRLQYQGIIVARKGPRWTVDTAAGFVEAERAVSCLVAPCVGDTVWMTGDQSSHTETYQTYYILAILKRDEHKALHIETERELVLRSAKRTVIAAKEEVALSAPKAISIATHELTMSANRAKLIADKLLHTSREVFSEMGTLKLVGGLFDTALERLNQKLKRSYRTVEELDMVRSEQIDYAAKKNLRLRGKNTLMTADNLVKVDGDQIHLG